MDPPPKPDTETAAEIDVFYEAGSNPSLSATLFFAFATAFTGAALVVHTWLVTLPSYKAVIKPFEAARGGVVLDEDDNDSSQPQTPEDERSLMSVHIQVTRPKNVSIWKVIRLNLMLNLAVCYVYVITLVGDSNLCPCFVIIFIS